MSDYDQIEDETFAALPPPLSPGEGNFDEDHAINGEGKIYTYAHTHFFTWPFSEFSICSLHVGEDGELSKLPDVPVAKRRIVKRPQPKLNSQRQVIIVYMTTVSKPVHQLLLFFK